MENYDNKNRPINDPNIYGRAAGLGVGALLHVWLLNQMVGSVRAYEHLDEFDQLFDDSDLPERAHAELRRRNGRYLGGEADEVKVRLAAQLRRDFHLLSDAEIFVLGDDAPEAYIDLHYDDAWRIKAAYDRRNEFPLPDMHESPSQAVSDLDRYGVSNDDIRRGIRVVF